jgi:hypothetical protein
MRRQSPDSEVRAHIIAWQKSNPRPLGSGTQSQESVRHITFLALKIMAVWRNSIAATPLWLAGAFAEVRQ